MSHAIISLIENIACEVFIDRENAFDTIDHTLLLNNLSYYGIRGIADRRFKSCLSNHAQCVFPSMVSI